MRMNPEGGDDEAVHADAQTETSPVDAQQLTQRVLSAVELLESIRDRRGQLAFIDDALRARLLQAAGHVARPDPWAKRELVRAADRRRREERRAADERALASTGIRQKRREQVFSTPPRLCAPVAPGSDIDRA